jgi:hypothetical protein
MHLQLNLLAFRLHAPLEPARGRAMRLGLQGMRAPPYLLGESA